MIRMIARGKTIIRIDIVTGGYLQLSARRDSTTEQILHSGLLVNRLPESWVANVFPDYAHGLSFSPRSVLPVPERD